MYCSQKYRGEGDFASLAIRNKRLEFRFNTGSGTATLQSEPLLQDKWVEVCSYQLVLENWLVKTATNQLMKAIKSVFKLLD